jgi:hypothetical protein
VPGDGPEGGEGLMAVCKSCGAHIEWLVMAGTGAKMPVDGKPEKRIVVLEDGTGKMVDAYLAHWATCPTAARHRRQVPRGEQDAQSNDTT